jgi:hypothetical protein
LKRASGFKLHPERIVDDSEVGFKCLRIMAAKASGGASCWQNAAKSYHPRLRTFSLSGIPIIWFRCVIAGLGVKEFLTPHGIFIARQCSV